MFAAAQIALALATFLCSLVAGFLFAFAVVVMPGTSTLGDREFLRAFQAIDRVIQRGQWLFLIVWMGSVVAVMTALALGTTQLAGLDLLLLALAGAVYVLGVQGPTFVVNIPLNNQVQALNLEGLDDAACRVARQRFEPRWNRWNATRTIFAVLTSAVLMTLLVRS